MCFEWRQSEVFSVFPDSQIACLMNESNLSFLEVEDKNCPLRLGKKEPSD